MMNPAKLGAALRAAGVTPANANRFALPLFAAVDAGGIRGRSLVMFLANVLHESGLLDRLTEGLNYSAAGLLKTFPTRFDAASAARYERRPEAIANFVYALRNGNGDEASGDGWRYRGAGLIQLTFKNNHRAASKHFGIPLEAFGDWLRTPEGASRSAAWFWNVNGCGAFAERGDFDGVCDKINRGRKTEAEGDSIGFAHRAELLQKLERALS